MVSPNCWPNFRQQSPAGGVKLLTFPAFWLPSRDPPGSYSHPIRPMAPFAAFTALDPDITDTPWLVLALAILVAFSIYLILRSKRK
jgi:hypothetical protein